MWHTKVITIFQTATGTLFKVDITYHQNVLDRLFHKCTCRIATLHTRTSLSLYLFRTERCQHYSMWSLNSHTHIKASDPIEYQFVFRTVHIDLCCDFLYSSCTKQIVELTVTSSQYSSSVEHNELEPRIDTQLQRY